MKESYVDQSMFDELLEIMGDDIQMLVDSYITDSKTRLQQMGSLNSKDDSETIFRLAHSLKGSSRNLGVTEFSNYCGVIEKNARDEQLDNSNYSHEKLVKLFEETILVIQEKISSR